MDLCISSSGRFKWLGILISLVAAGACSPASQDFSTPFGRQAITFSARAALNAGDCATGFLLVQPWYASNYSDNDARLLMASVHGCYAGVKVLDLITNLALDPNNLSGNGFWRFLTRYFPSVNTPSDRVLENALAAIRSGQAALIPGRVLNPLFVVNGSTVNPQSLVIADRVADGNAYLAFSGMATVGAIQNRFGAPNASFAKTVNLTGQTAVTVNAVACQYASGLINFMDGISGITQASSGTTAAALKTVDDNFRLLISSSCELGCTGTAPPAGVASGCALPVCTGCPTALRNPDAVCTGVATDQNSCAAAGLINFINNNPFGWN